MPLLPKYPIYIPSKGRAGNLKTGKAFDRDGVPYRVVIEPSQVSAYQDAGYSDKILVLPEDGKGLVYSRNWITNHSVKEGTERHWQIDDDIDDFYRLYRGYRLRCNAGAALAVSEEFADRYENVALLSLNSTFFVTVSRGRSNHSDYPPFYRNHRCYTIILFLNSLPNRWRPPNNEDTDMTLQVLADGWCTILLNAFLIDTETTMLAKGGQTEAFKMGARLKMVRALERRWPGVVRVGRRFGHPQHFIKGEWSFFDTPLKLKNGIDLKAMAGSDEKGMFIKALKEPKSENIKKLLAS
jgi:hypothetical protein